MKKGMGISRRQFIKISISGVGGLCLQGPLIGLPESNAAVIKSKNNPTPEFFLLKPTFKVPDSCKVLFFKDKREVLRSASEKCLKYEKIFPKGIPQITLLLPVDLVNLKLETKGFILEKKGILHKNLVLAKKGNGEHLLKFIFPPQHIVEEYHRYKENVVFQLPFDARLVGESRLVFDLNKGKGTEVDSIPLTLENLLKWDDYQLSVVPVALPNLKNYPSNPPLLGEIGDYETLIELPFGMFLSPHLFAGVEQNDKNSECSEINNYTELWHASIIPMAKSLKEDMSKKGVGEKEGAYQVEDYQTVRAVGYLQNDFIIGCEKNKGNEKDKNNKPLPYHCDRRQIVHLSSDFSLKTKPPDEKPYNPQAIHYTNLKLSSYGAFAKLHGRWPVGDLLCDEQLCPDIEDWQHETVWGRDRYVRIQKLGYIMPWGHKVSYIQILKRYMLDVSSQFGRSKADYLVFREKCIVQESEKSYVQPEKKEGTLVSKGMAMPFKWVKIVEKETPYLTTVPFESCNGAGGKPKERDYKENCNEKNNGDQNDPCAFWMQFEGTQARKCESTEFPYDFKFTIEAEDWQGNKFHFKQTLVWVKGKLAEGDSNNTTFDAILNEYGKCKKRRNPEFNVQKLAFYRAEVDNAEGVKSSKQDDAFDTIELDIRVDEAHNVTNPLGWGDTCVRGNQGEYTKLPFPGGWQLRFYPAMNWAKVKLDGVAEFSPQQGEEPFAEITYT